MIYPGYAMLILKVDDKWGGVGEIKKKTETKHMRERTHTKKKKKKGTHMGENYNKQGTQKMIIKHNTNTEKQKLTRWLAVQLGVQNQCFLKILGSYLRSGGLNRSLLHEILIRIHWK